MIWIRLLTARRPAPVRYAAAVVAAGTAIALIGLFERWKVGSGTILAFDVAAIAFSALFGGAGPAIVTAVVSALGIDFFFIAPTYAIGRSIPGYLELSVDICFALAMSALIAKLRASVLELDRMSDLRAQMLAMVAHDLRNPLSSIRLSVAMLRRLEGKKFDPARLAKFADQIDGSAGRMDRLIADLLDSEKIRGGQFAVQPAWENVETILHDAVLSVGRPAALGDVRIQVAPIRDDVRVYADAAQLLRVIGNVLSNAVKFSPRGGIVEVRFERHPEHFRISVTDQGPGIRPEVRARLFERSWQASETAHRGTGLGLYISAGIVKAHGGKIAVESEVGKGSRFVVEIPCPRTPGLRTEKVASEESRNRSST